MSRIFGMDKDGNRTITKLVRMAVVCLIAFLSSPLAVPFLYITFTAYCKETLQALEIGANK
jgi:hypothetical protein